MSTQFNTERLALVVTDPQNDFLSEQGVTWGVVGESVVKNNTVENKVYRSKAFGIRC